MRAPSSHAAWLERLKQSRDWYRGQEVRLRVEADACAAKAFKLSREIGETRDRWA